ncbi:MAG: hypothetical protein RBS39_06495 [Phycisphaerales bacterium]|jgi:hypothetical protein|nr:hypothetical protein [Phycisphaerales bacterium]
MGTVIEVSMFVLDGPGIGAVVERPVSAAALGPSADDARGRTSGRLGRVRSWEDAWSENVLT